MLLDVVEHLKDDREALQDVRRILKPGGIALITVPAFQFLWTDHDVQMHHYRRYTKGQLHRVISDAGLKPLLLSYYNFFLFPPIAMLRVIDSLRGKKKGSDLARTPKMVNGYLAALFGSERLFLPYVPLPFGVSLIAVARKT